MTKAGKNMGGVLYLHGVKSECICTGSKSDLVYIINALGIF